VQKNPAIRQMVNEIFSVPEIQYKAPLPPAVRAQLLREIDSYIEKLRNQERPDLDQPAEGEEDLRRIYGKISALPPITTPPPTMQFFEDEFHNILDAHNNYIDEAGADAEEIAVSEWLKNLQNISEGVVFPPTEPLTRLGQLTAPP